MAVVRAFLLVTTEPIGQGVDHDLAYQCQGMKPGAAWTKPWPYRWRSLDRWAAQVEAWWPGRAVSHVQALLAGFISEAGDDFHHILGRASASHVRRGVLM